jgi:hypothetical protein
MSKRVWITIISAALLGGSIAFCINAYLFHGIRITRTNEGWYITKQHGVGGIVNPGTKQQTFIMVFVCKDRHGVLRAVGWSQLGLSMNGGISGIVYDEHNAGRGNLWIRSPQAQQFLEYYREVGGP